MDREIRKIIERNWVLVCAHYVLIIKSTEKFSTAFSINYTTQGPNRFILEKLKNYRWDVNKLLILIGKEVYYSLVSIYKTYSNFQISFNINSSHINAIL